MKFARLSHKCLLYVYIFHNMLKEVNFLKKTIKIELIFLRPGVLNEIEFPF